MAVPTAITDLSITAASNSPAGSDSVFPNLDDYLRAAYAFIAQNYADKLAKAGGTMTGALTLSGAPTVDLHASTKKYADDTAATVQTNLDTLSAGLKHAFAAKGTTQTSGSTIVPGTELYDSGTCFSVATGLFTAPVDGVYAFSASVLFINTDSSNKQTADLVLEAAGTVLAITGVTLPAAVGSSNIATLSVSGIASMTATQTARIYTDGSIAGAKYITDSSFSGRILWRT